MTLKFDVEEVKNGVYHVTIQTPEMEATVEATHAELRRLLIDLSHEVEVPEEP